MASIPSLSQLDFLAENQKLDFDTIKLLVTIINQYMHDILENTEAQEALKLKCTSKLKIQSQEFFEFSEHSVLSNLYWGIENAESAYRAQNADEKLIKLDNSEKMLQIPASLDEIGVTMGISNGYLVCCSYFYLSVVEFVRKNEWQVAMHFLQAVLICPTSVRTEFAPGIYQRLLPIFVRYKFEKKLLCRTLTSDFDDDDDGEDDCMVDDVMRWMAKTYKPWLVYYQIMSSGEFKNRGSGTCLADNHIEYAMKSVLRSKTVESQKSYDDRNGLWSHRNLEELYTQCVQANIGNDVQKDHIGTNLPFFESHKKILTCSETIHIRESTKSSNIRCLKDILIESEPNSPISQHSANSSPVEDISAQIFTEVTIGSLRIGRFNAEDHEAAVDNQNDSLSWNSRSLCHDTEPEKRALHQIQTESDRIKSGECFSRSFSTSYCDTNKFALPITKLNQHTPTLNDYIHEQEQQEIPNAHSKRHKNSQTIRKSSSCRHNLLHSQQDENTAIEHQNALIKKLISKLCFANGEDHTIDMKSIYEMLNSKPGLKYSLLKDIILDQLLTAISTSKEDRVVRTSLAILSTIVTQNQEAIEEIKRKGLKLYDLATALKRNVHEAVVLIYLINPSPAEMRTLELLPCLVEVVCACRKPDPAPPLLTPPSASLMIIEVLVTAFDGETNGAHLAAISSPRVLSRLVRVPRGENPEELVSLAAVLVECMRFDGECRKYVVEYAPVADLVSLLWRNERRAARVALEFFNELLRMPRSSASGLLEQIQKQGSVNNACALLVLTQNPDTEYRLLAANLLLQLQVLENTSVKRVHKEEATEIIIDSLTREDYPATQALSAFILSNLGGTYSWTGEPYTTAWLVKKTGLTSAHHRNLIKHFDFHDPSLQDGGIDPWSSRTAQRVLCLGAPVFHALTKGLESNFKRVSRDCLVAAAWLGCELVKGPNELRHSACDILLESIEQYMHPGSELEERLLACLCIYNYTSGKGMKKIINLSEGVRESLRRLSNVTWMAEELLQVADYFQPNKWRISCVHSQILEVGNKNSGAVTALIYYRGLLYSGYANGSIKVWDIKRQTATLIQEMKEHKKAVTCFALYEPRNCLLSGSNDKTIKIWQMLQKNLECIEVIPTKESVRSIDACGELIFASTQSHKLKVIDASRKSKDVFKNKRVKCVRVSQGKVYGGCMDSSIQELMIVNNRQQEIKAPLKSWMQTKPISSVAMYKDWLYCASSAVEGSKIKEWRRSNKPQISIMPEKGASVVSMEVLEDFIYINCSTSMSSLQIWLRGTQQKVGRLSAGSKITSLLSANDIILCGTEKGLIKGWIPI
ncbi:transducin/WD40 repeat-like superfamily protein [Striga asiatica]|uniref:Transducin/WD40 repeat-like superfamily protein n=1 Tax=Striga asiatica TaxID=4170 RepID=A0A5A7R3Y6_STRAF|nr:transducin/WD40 repeat-like superfamily protein [Striga asiatica]